MLPFAAQVPHWPTGSRRTTTKEPRIHKLSTSGKRDTTNGLRQTNVLKVSRLVALLHVQETGTNRHDKR